MMWLITYLFVAFFALWLTLWAVRDFVLKIKDIIDIHA